MLPPNLTPLSLSRIVVLGHTGFIGRRVFDALNGHFPDVEIIGHSLAGLDLTSEPEAQKLGDEFDRNTSVVMCAGVKRQWGDNLSTFLQNVQMAVNVAKVLEQHPVRSFVFFSSAAVYGEDIENICITEDTPVCARSFYGLAKHVSEEVFLRVMNQSDTRSVLFVRPPLIYGPGDQSYGYGPCGFVRSACRGETVTLWGDGSEQREFVFIDDVVRLVLRLISLDYRGPINIASGTSHTFAEVIQVLSSLIGRNLDVAVRERTKPKVDQKFLNNKLKDVAPEMSFTPLAEGIRRTLEAEVVGSGVNRN